MKMERQARTRTLIQVGGLVEKAGLLSDLGILPGQDLQRDVTVFPKVSMLLGALQELAQQITSASPETLVAWMAEGRAQLQEPTSHDDD